MLAKILDGQAVSQLYLKRLKKTLDGLRLKGFHCPKLAVIVVGNNPASRLYVANKKKACEAIGIESISYEIPASTPQKDLMELITTLNQDRGIHGILLQLPLPDNLDADSLIQCIDPKKDVDGLHPYNMGHLLNRTPLLRPCTPQGIIALLEHYKIPMISQKVVIVGQSNMVGRPLAIEFLAQKATVVLCHSHTHCLASEVALADILVACLGKARYILGDWIKKGAVVVDVGINRLSNNTLCGDVEFEKAQQRAAWITPVPKGVGPMTVAMLLSNTLLAMTIQQKITEKAFNL